MSKGSFSDRLKKKSQGLTTENNPEKSAQKEPDPFALKEDFEDESDDFSSDSNDSEPRSLAAEEKVEEKNSTQSEDENNQKSFADRFAKKPAFSSQKVDDKKPQKKNDLTDIANVDPKKRAQADLIYLVKGIDDGRNAWYYVLVDRPKVQLFLKALNDDIIHLENYGVILYSAYGDDPPQEITDAINKEYGIR